MSNEPVTYAVAAERKRTTQWRDHSGRVWDFRIGIEVAKRLKEAGTDLMNPQTIKEVFGSPLSLIEFVGELARPEWEKLELTYEQFADRLIHSEDSFLQVQDSIEFAIVDFFRRIGQKHHAVVAERAMESAARVMEQSVTIADQRTRKLATKLERRVLEKIESEFDRLDRMDGASLEKLGG